MSITHPPEPAGGRPLLEAHVAEILAHPRLANRALCGAHQAALDVAQPHQVYTLTSNDIAGRRDLATLSPDAWRYLLFAGPRAVAAVELSIGATPPPLRFAHVNSGRVVTATARALTLAEALPAVQKADYEARLLRAPTLLFVALWLHGPRDIVFTLSPHGVALPVDTPHSGGDVLAALLAKQSARGA